MDKIQTKKTYTITIEQTAGKETMTRVNDGFAAMELLGILELTQMEIIDTIQERIKPDIIVRQAIKDRKKSKNG